MPQNTAPIVSWRGEHAKLPLPLRVFGRYFITGQALRGGGDNATFLHRATVDYRARPYVKLTGPKWQRLARRHAAVTVPLVLACWDWRAAVAWWTVTLLAAVAWAVRAAVRALSRGRQYREWVDPAARVLCSMTGYRYTKRRGRELIMLPAGWKAGCEEQACVRIPAGVPLNDRLKKAITENLAERLGIPSPVTGDWRVAGADAHVYLKAAPMPPVEVTLDELRPAMECADATEVILGKAPGGALVRLSLAEDTPHIAMSGPSGTGKSVVARLIITQRVAFHGDGAIILDPKRWSHWRWAGAGKVDKTKIRYAWRTEELHEAWLEIAAEATRRMEIDDEEELERQRRVFILAEELNTQTKRLARYWRAERKRIIVETKMRLADDPDADVDLGDLDPPLQSPAIVAMQEAVAMGRELKMHVVVAAQRLSASVFGGNGGDIRESFQGGRLIAKWDRKLWKMLVDTIAYVAWPGGKRGLWGLARDEDFTIFRVPFLSERLATQIVASGVATYGPVLGHGQRHGHGQIDGQAAGHGQLAITSAVTLAMAIDELPGQDGPVAITLARLRRASTEAGFPAPLAKPDGQEYGRTEARLYNLAELIEWRESVLAGIRG
jgi:hypothetical protein